jgi:alpha-tubulin suppressor-like RCC1 family protein
MSRSRLELVAVVCLAVFASACSPLGDDEGSTWVAPDDEPAANGAPAPDEQDPIRAAGSEQRDGGAVAGPKGKGAKPANEEPQEPQEPQEQATPAGSGGREGGSGAGGDEGSEETSAGGSLAVDDVPPEVRAGEPAHFLSVDSGFVRCGIKTDHTLWCWGEGSSWFPTWNEARYPAQVGRESDWSSISVGSYSLCGIRGAGDVHCWGQLYSTSGWRLEEIPRALTPAQTWRSVSTGMAGACGIKSDGSLWCWGYLRELTDGAVEVSDEPIQIGLDDDWAQVSNNGYRACAIKDDASLWCFGSNFDAGLGNGSLENRGQPTLVAEAGPWLDVAAGISTCAVRFDHTLWCWGSTLGPEPWTVDPNTDWEEVESRDSYPCALRGGGKLYCLDWTNAMDAIDEGGGYTSVSSTCAVHADQTLGCWGWGTLGDGSGNIVPAPVRVGTEDDWTAVSMAHQRITALHDGGRMDTFFGPIHGTSGWLEISESGIPACAIRDDHTLWCWGRNWGASSDEYPYGDIIPAQVGASADWLHVTATFSGWVCGIRDADGDGNGSLWCKWPDYNPALLQAGSFSDWRTIDGRGGSACGVRANGTLWCWSMSVQCGYGGFVGVPQFEQVGSDDDWQRVSVGSAHQCALKKDNSLWCRGRNFFGALGTGTRADSTTMLPVAPGTSWREVSAGDLWTCGLQSDGSLWCWGDHRHGELGLGFPGATRLNPERVGSATDWSSLATSVSADAVSCGLRSGSLWCWGQNQMGLVTRGLAVRGVATVVDAPEPPLPFCTWPSDKDYDGYAGCLGDCNDADFSQSPFQSELCNATDDDCDGSIDELVCQ